MLSDYSLLRILDLVNTKIKFCEIPPTIVAL